MSSLGAVVTSHLSLPHPGPFLHKSGKCRQLFAVLGAMCHWKKMFQTSVIVVAKIREYSTVVRFIWWVRWCDFNLSDAQISLCPTRTPYASQYVLGYLEVRSTCPMGQSLGGKGIIPVTSLPPPGAGKSHPTSTQGKEHQHHIHNF